MAIAKGFHLFPFRTQKLSPYTSTILGWQRPGKIDSRRILHERPQHLLRSFAFYFSFLTLYGILFLIEDVALPVDLFLPYINIFFV